ncbi:MAG: ParB/RepB/Spo0J family partition protein [Clostridia bacterium]|nr:ParB/RepB/Spo0J family partition protein [Clostridia bacterium]
MNDKKKAPKPVLIPLDKLHPFPDHPYKVKDNEEMDRLVNSILEHGILTPILARPIENTDGELEILSGHRRCHAAKRAFLSAVPTIVCALTRDEAAVLVVDSNLHRERLLPSEKAKAYKLKFDALKHQGRYDYIFGNDTSGQVVPKPDDRRTSALIGEAMGESYKTVDRYIRLTELIPDLMSLVDSGRIAFSVGVELSYLNEEQQHEISLDAEVWERTPSYSQAVRMHKEQNLGTLTIERMQEIMNEDKPNQKEHLSLPMERISKYIPKGYTPKQAQEYVENVLEQAYKRRMRSREEER